MVQHIILHNNFICGIRQHTTRTTDCCTTRAIDYACNLGAFNQVQPQHCYVRQASSRGHHRRSPGTGEVADDFNLNSSSRRRHAPALCLLLRRAAHPPDAFRQKQGCTQIQQRDKAKHTRKHFPTHHQDSNLHLHRAPSSLLPSCPRSISPHEVATTAV